MTASSTTYVRRAPARLAVLSLLLAGCAASAATPRPTAAPPATPTATVSVAFAVGVTPVPLRPAAKRRPARRRTASAAPRGPYIRLAPAAGPPVSRTIAVRGGNLPSSSPILLVWSPGGRISPISTISWTDRRGSLSANFAVPGSPPGRYEVIAEAGTVPLASAQYVVTSNAQLSVRASSSPSGVHLSVQGKRFLPRLRLLLIIYPLARGGRPIILAAVRSGRRGHFAFQTNRRLVPGEYVLRALPTDSLVAQTVDTFFQVVA